MIKKKLVVAQFAKPKYNQNRSNLTKILQYYLRDEFGHPNLMEGGFN